MKNNTYIVALETFTGPLDLLHQLIEKRKLQINTISLAKVTADYLSHVEKHTKNIQAEEISQFIYVASILVLIKSKSLLPVLEYTKEEEGSVAELEERMRLFRFIKEKAMPAISVAHPKAVAVTLPTRQKKATFLPDNSCTKTHLHQSARSVLQELVFLKDPPKKTVAKTISLEEVVERILGTVVKRVTVSFHSLTGKKDKPETIVSFLAILELVRKDVLTADQKGIFNDILVAKKTEV